MQQIIVMDKGEIVGIGNHNELLKNCPTYQILYQAEMYENKEEYNYE